MTRLIELEKLGQSVWFDFIRRSLITSGELQALIDKGVRGITSNPAIFEKAIAGSNDYDEAIKAMIKTGKSIDLNAITQKLQNDGVIAFAKPFDALMQSLAEKRERLTQHGA